MKFTSVDKQALLDNNDSYFLDKGARLYNEEYYEEAIEYYRIAATLGNMQAVSNLGYCYMYGRSIAKDMDLAIAYFQMAANEKVIDALYKLGTIYLYGISVPVDKPLGLYYLYEAQGEINTYQQALMYPSLHLTLAKHWILEEDYHDIQKIHYFLTIAKEGYEEEIAKGGYFYKKAYEEVLSLLDNPCFDDLEEE